MAPVLVPGPMVHHLDQVSVRVPQKAGHFARGILPWFPIKVDALLG